MEYMAKTGNLSKFHSMLQEQVRHEFTASQQYVALAVWFDSQDLPQLAKHFYRQSLEERNHAMMIVQYLLDNDIAPLIPGVDDVRTNFSEAADLVSLALQQEKSVTDEIINLAKIARDEDDYKGEQFMQWFLKEQVEEVAQMTTMLNVVRRARRQPVRRGELPGPRVGRRDRRRPAGTAHRRRPGLVTARSPAPEAHAARGRCRVSYRASWAGSANRPSPSGGKSCTATTAAGGIGP